MLQLNIFYEELISFLGIGPAVEIFSSGRYEQLLSLSGILALVGPLIPFLLLIELGRVLIYRKFRIEDYRVPMLIFVSNRLISRVISLGVVAFCIAVLEKHALIRIPFTWYYLLFGYVIWELGHFIYHYLAHKVRLLWCLHSTHHAPEAMNLSVNFAHFFLEAPYADLIRTSTCILLGVSPPMLFLIMFIDGTWGGFIHVGEHLMKKGKLGFMDRLILTPSHHRVHHSRNPLYMDTNFCNLLSVWDRLFGTWQPLQDDQAPQYGITRPINSNNFIEVYFGEFYALWKDVRSAPGFTNKFFYLLMPPGWTHTGEHKTARTLRRSYLEAKNKTVLE